MYDILYLYSARLLPGAAHPLAWQPTNTVSPKPNMLAGLTGCTWTWRSETQMDVDTFREAAVGWVKFSFCV